MPPRYFKTKCRLCKQYKMTRSGFSYCFECWEKSRKKDDDTIKPSDIKDDDIVKEKAKPIKKVVKKPTTIKNASKKSTPKKTRKVKKIEF